MEKIKKRINQEGITLIEILVAMMIFSFIVGGIVVFGVRAIEAHTKSQAMQNSLENARFAIESISKRARTSSGINQVGDQEVFFIDNASGNSYCYRFTTNAGGQEILEVGEGTADNSSCTDIVSSEELIGDSKIAVTGSFDVTETDIPNDSRGRLRISIKISYVGALGVQSDSERTIQSTVSLRDY